MGDLLMRAGKTDPAKDSLRKAMELSNNAKEVSFLANEIQQLWFGSGVLSAQLTNFRWVFCQISKIVQINHPICTITVIQRKSTSFMPHNLYISAHKLYKLIPKICTNPVWNQSATPLNKAHTPPCQRPTQPVTHNDKNPQKAAPSWNQSEWCLAF